MKHDQEVIPILDTTIMLVGDADTRRQAVQQFTTRMAELLTNLDRGAAPQGATRG